MESPLCVFEEAQTVLELRDPELELVPVLTRDEAKLAREALEALPCSLARAHGVAAPPRRGVVEQRTSLVEPRPEEGDQPVERVALG